MSLNVPTIYGHIDRYIPVKLSYERMRSDQKIMMIDGEHCNGYHIMYVTRV